MNAVIKSGSDTGRVMVRPFGAAQTGGGGPEAPTDVLARRVEELEAALAVRDLREAAFESEIQASFERGKAAGHALGLKAADAREGERLGLLEKGIAQAHASFAESLSGTEHLAALIARDCLDKILGEPDFRAEILCGLIRAQIRTMEQNAVLLVKVSRADLLDSASLARLQEAAGAGVDLEIDDGLVSGDCAMSLRLGDMDIGLNQQWGALAALLGELGEGKPEQ